MSKQKNETATMETPKTTTLDFTGTTTTTETTTETTKTRTIDDLAAGDTEQRVQGDVDVVLIAQTLVALRRAIEDHRLRSAQELSAFKVGMAQLKESVQGCHKRVDDFAELWARQRGDMEGATRQAGEQLKQAGKTARDINDKLQAFEEARAAAPDLTTALRPIKVELGEIKDRMKALDKSVDIRFEGLPGAKRKPPMEIRGDGPTATPGGPERKRRAE